jgi:hypothetical protein
MAPVEMIEKTRSAGLPVPSAAHIARMTGCSLAEAQAAIGGKHDNAKVVANKKKDHLAPNDASSRAAKSVGADTKAGNEATAVLPARSLREKVQAVLVASLPIIFFTAAAVGSYRSFTLCYSFFARFNTADGAITMSVLLVALAFGMPQATHILWPDVRKGKRIFVFILACLLSVASIGTNVVITAQELQNQKSDSRTALTADQELRTQLQARIAELEGQRQEKQEALELDKQERAILMEAQKGLVVGEYQYNRVRINLDQIKKRIDMGLVEINGINKQIADAMALMPAGQDEAVQAGTVDTIVNWMGSIIIEIGGPVALALSLCL